MRGAVRGGGVKDGGHLPVVSWTSIVAASCPRVAPDDGEVNTALNLSVFSTVSSLRVKTGTNSAICLGENSSILLTAA